MCDSDLNTDAHIHNVNSLKKKKCLWTRLSGAVERLSTASHDLHQQGEFVQLSWRRSVTGVQIPDLSPREQCLIISFTLHACYQVKLDLLKLHVINLESSRTENLWCDCFTSFMNPTSSDRP